MANMKLNHKSDQVEILSGIQVPGKYYNRVKTGVQVLDEIFGGQEVPGLPPFISMLFTGMPGAGKTTMVMQLADLIQRVEGASVLYNVGEQNKYVVKMNADRMGLKGNFAISQFGDVNKLTEYCEKNGVTVLIQDSLQTLSDGELSGNKLIKSVGEKLTEFSDRAGVLSIIVGHITKGGDFAGPMQLKHTVDMHAHLSFNKDTGNRIFELKKNRFGPALMPYEFFLGADGMDFRQMEDPTETAQKVRSSQKKEEICKKAKELLLKGKKLSGYSFQDDDELAEWLKSENYEVSGGYWRGILGMASKELEREGTTIETRHINRRAHVFVAA